MGDSRGSWRGRKDCPPKAREASHCQTGLPRPLPPAWPGCLLLLLPGRDRQLLAPLNGYTVHLLLGVVLALGALRESGRCCPGGEGGQDEMTLREV